MTKVLYYFYRRLSLVRRWSRRRLTPAGWFVLAGFCLATLLAANPAQTVAYQAWVLMLVVLATSLAYSPFFRIRVTITRRLPRFATLGEALRYRVRFQNRAGRIERGLDYIEDFRGGELDLEAFAERVRPGRRNRSFQLSAPLAAVDPAVVRPIEIPAVPAGGTIEFTGEVTPRRRGPLHFLRVRVGRRDPLGLFRSLRRVPAPASVMVLPRRYPVRHLALPGQTSYQHRGVTFASGIGESGEFVGVREYRRGDSLRRLHWRVTARMGRPVVREYQDEFFMRHALVLDTFCDVSVDTLFEDAVSVAASFACTVPDQDSLLDLLFIGPKTVCVTSGRGVGQTEHMLEMLACARPCRQPRFAELSDLILGHSPRLSGCLLVLLDWDAPRRALVGQLKAMRIPVWAFVIVPPDEKPVDGAGPAAEQPDRLILLESGRIAEGLRDLHTQPSAGA